MGLTYKTDKPNTLIVHLSKKLLNGRIDSNPGSFIRFQEINETIYIADKHPEIVKQILKIAEKEKSVLGEWKNKDPEVRKTIFVKDPKPLIKIEFFIE